MGDFRARRIFSPHWVLRMGTPHALGDSVQLIPRNVTISHLSLFYPAFPVPPGSLGLGMEADLQPLPRGGGMWAPQSRSSILSFPPEWGFRPSPSLGDPMGCRGRWIWGLAERFGCSDGAELPLLSPCRITGRCLSPTLSRIHPLVMQSSNSCFFSCVCTGVIDATAHSSSQLVDKPGGRRSKRSACGTGRLLLLGQPK